MIGKSSKDMISKWIEIVWFLAGPAPQPPADSVPITRRRLDRRR